MASRAVALVLRKPVLRINPVEITHHVVTTDFRQDRCGTNGRDQPIATDDRLTLNWPAVKTECRQTIAVDERLKWFDPEPQERTPHGQECALQYVERIDFGRVCPPYSAGQRIRPDNLDELLTTPLRQLFRVSKTFDRAFHIENDRGSHNRPGERPASGFVYSGDERQCTSPFRRGVNEPP